MLSKERLAGDTARVANTDKVREPRREVMDLKEVVAEQRLGMRLLKKTCSGIDATANKVCCIREVGDHSTGRGESSASAKIAVQAGYPTDNILPLV